MQHSTFFADQLAAFELWLKFGDEHKKPPLQLPIVLQVLLSQDYRSQALHLLARFLDMGPWAVGLALAVGIFPYVLKLLQSPAADLRSVLVFIWAKIMAVERVRRVRGWLWPMMLGVSSIAVWRLWETCGNASSETRDDVAGCRIAKWSC